MSWKPDHIAKTVITIALTATLGGCLMGRGGVLSTMGTVLFFAAIASVPIAVPLLIFGQSGWRDLSRAFPGTAFAGPWRTGRTVMMSAVGLDDPTYVRRRVRFSFIVKVGADAHALHLTTIPVVRWVLTPITVPWSAIAAVRAFDASGWVTPPSEPGALWQAMYDPGYRGEFVEIEVREPNYFVQVPSAFVRDRSPRG